MSKPISFFHPATLIGTCFGIGKMPFMPGTFGSLFGVILLVIIAILPHAGIIDKSWLFPLLIAVTLLLYAIGTWATQLYIKRTGKSDPREIVIDEVVGMFVAALAVAAGYAGLLIWDSYIFEPLLVLAPQYLIVLFVLFRIFDITKPGPVGWLDKNMKGEHGVMLDDVAAGICAALAFLILFLVLHFSGALAAIFSTYFPQFIGVK